MPWANFNQQFRGNYLLAWIEMANNIWDVKATAPQGTWVREFIYVPKSGNLTMNRSSGGSTINRDYGYTMPGYRYVWFYVDKKGNYVSVFNLGGLQSNEITISVY